MLVLTRKLGERIQIGDDISVVIIKIDRSAIQIGIEAPRSIEIFREELPPEKRKFPKPPPSDG